MHKLSKKNLAVVRQLFVLKPVQLVGYVSYASLSAKLFPPDKKCA